MFRNFNSTLAYGCLNASINCLYLVLVSFSSVPSSFKDRKYLFKDEKSFIILLGCHTKPANTMELLNLALIKVTVLSEFSKNFFLISANSQSENRYPQATLQYQNLWCEYNHLLLHCGLYDKGIHQNDILILFSPLPQLLNYGDQHLQRCSPLPMKHIYHIEHSM